MRRCVFLAVVACGFCQTADAAILAQTLTFNGTTDRLVDDSTGRILFGADDKISVGTGDIIQGIFQINKALLDGGPPPSSLEADLNTPTKSVYGVYSFEVTGITTVGTSQVISVGAASSSQTISSILSAAGFASTGLIDNPANGLTLADAGIVVFEKTGSTTLGDFDVSGGFVTGGAIGGTISAAAGWAPSIILGFGGDDFHQIKLDETTVLGTTYSGSDLLEKSNLDAINSVANNPPSPLVPFDVTFGSFAGAYSVIEHGFGASTEFLPLGALKLSDGSIAIGDVVTAGSTSIANATTGEIGRGWIFGDKGDFAINAVPEPMSMFIWAGMGAVFCFGGIRRRFSQSSRAC